MQELKCRLGHGQSGSNPEPPLAVTPPGEILHGRVPGNFLVTGTYKNLGITRVLRVFRVK
jgi:hypothetical protein